MISEKPELGATAEFKIIGKGKVKLPINGGLAVRAYHTTGFPLKNNIGKKLVKTFEVLFSEHLRPHSCYILMKSGILQIIQEFSLIGDTYPIRVDLNKPKTFQEKRSSVDTSEWQRRVGHPSPELYFKLSEFFSDVPKFDKPTL